MGLCKCPKKKVTSLFCFEHRVNVCEHCLVTNHTRCIVQSYLQWLQDSDYDPQCKLCNQSLGASGPCVRLMCYDVFHWKCLDEFARALPPTTAPAGYTCPACRSAVFPGTNVASPVADSLRSRLADASWAKAGLGLPMMNPAHEAQHSRRLSTTLDIDVPEASSGLPSPPPPPSHNHNDSHSTPAYGRAESRDSVLVSRDTAHTETQHSSSSHMVGVSSSSTPAIALSGTTSTTKTNASCSTPSNNATIGKTSNHEQDHDQDKYKRRPAMQWIQRWWRSRMLPGKGVKSAKLNKTRRCIAIVVLLLFAFLTFVAVMYRFGRGTGDAEDDPFKQLPDNVAVHN